MLLHASAYMATHPQPKRDDRVALQLWVKGLYRIMVAARPPSRITDEDLVHALAFHTSRDISEIRGSVHVARLRETCESALEGLRVFHPGVE
ncbi:MAG: hypothetical protein EPN79_02210 [Burkholderiaceae bacterium]|nr:MAG: hypothetical protein EPN79_02210 [Burkholderiaceae bacterium]TBR76151.1 MAG: hypothetical protein EPN64_09065 [Burkholderiaceae bacterium]